MQRDCQWSSYQPWGGRRMIRIIMRGSSKQELKTEDITESTYDERSKIRDRIEITK